MIIFMELNILNKKNVFYKIKLSCYIIIIRVFIIIFVNKSYIFKKKLFLIHIINLIHILYNYHT